MWAATSWRSLWPPCTTTCSSPTTSVSAGGSRGLWPWGTPGCCGPLGRESPPQHHPALLPTVNDVRDAVRSVSSYMLFDPDDAVMQQNLVYYRFHRERWRLQEEDFEPRPVRTPQTPVPWLCRQQRG